MSEASADDRLGGHRHGIRLRVCPRQAEWLWERSGGRTFRQWFIERIREVLSEVGPCTTWDVVAGEEQKHEREHDQAERMARWQT